jgi:hypothetical protein
LSNKKSGKSIIFTAIDRAGVGFNLAKTAFIALNGGTLGSGTLEGVVAEELSRQSCGLK